VEAGRAARKLLLWSGRREEDLDHTEAEGMARCILGKELTGPADSLNVEPEECKGMQDISLVFG
jgi:hypothetical protein